MTCLKMELSNLCIVYIPQLLVQVIQLLTMHVQLTVNFQTFSENLFGCCFLMAPPESHKHKHKRRQHRQHHHELHRHDYHQYGGQAPPPAFNQLPYQPRQHSSAIYSQDPSMQVL